MRARVTDLIPLSPCAHTQTSLALRPTRLSHRTAAAAARTLPLSVVALHQLIVSIDRSYPVTLRIEPISFEASWAQTHSTSQSESRKAAKHATGREKGYDHHSKHLHFHTRTTIYISIYTPLSKSTSLPPATLCLGFF